jgi:hypothetical protein
MVNLRLFRFWILKIYWWIKNQDMNFRFVRSFSFIRGLFKFANLEILTLVCHCQRMKNTQFQWVMLIRKFSKKSFMEGWDFEVKLCEASSWSFTWRHIPVLLIAWRHLIRSWHTSHIYISRYAVVWRLLALGVFGALVGIITEIFVVTKDYSNNVGVCISTSVSRLSSTQSYIAIWIVFLPRIEEVKVPLATSSQGLTTTFQDQEYATVHLICSALVKFIAVMFLVVSYVLIIRKYVRNKVSVGELKFSYRWLGQSFTMWNCHIIITW